MRLRIFVIFSILTIWMLGFFSFYNKTKLELNLNEKNVDGIVVLTGSNFRISKGTEIFKKTNAKRLLISGIDQSVNANTIKNLHLKGLDNLINFVDLGYGSFSTISNALETSIWIKKYNFETIGIVTTKLHMPRSIFIFQKIMPEIEFVPMPTEYANNNIFSIINEFHKFYITKISSYFLSLT